MTFSTALAETGVSTFQLAAGAVLVVTLLFGGLFIYVWQLKRRIDAQVDDAIDEAEQNADSDEPPVVNLEPPAVQIASLGLTQTLLRLYSTYRKRRKLATKGYVQWYFMDSTFPTPKYVKPEEQGGGIPELKHDGDRYLFPREALVPSETEGMWTAVHKRGDAMPINLGTPGRPAIESDELEEYLNLRVSAEPPSALDFLFDIEPEQLLTYTIIGLAIFMIAFQVLG